jgi:putrescine aminotransferase
MRAVYDTMVCAPPLIWTEAQFEEAGAAIQKALDQTLADVRGELAA